MDTAAIRPYASIVHDPPHRRDDVTGSATTTDLPTEKTVRAAQPSDPSRSTGNGAGDHPTIKTGFERDLASGSIVYRWTDQTIDRVILEIPRSDRIRSRTAYEGQTQTADGSSVDRSV